MPPRSKRRSPAPGAEQDSPSKSRTKRNNANSKPRAAPSASSAYSDSECMKWFHSYLEPGETDMGPTGTMRMCEEANVLPEHPGLLVLAWRAQCEKMGTFTAREWLAAMQPLRCKDAVTLGHKLPEVATTLDDPSVLKEVFRYAYQYTRTAMENPSQKSIDKDSAIAMLRVLLSGRWSGLPLFIAFLHQHPCKIINKDQWMSIYEFQASVKPDFSNYDSDSAWPVILDEFVEWAKAQEK